MKVYNVYEFVMILLSIFKPNVRFWKRVFVKLVRDKDNNPCVQLFETKESKDAFQELPLQPAYSLSDIGHQVFDQYSKLFTRGCYIFGPPF